MNSFNLMRNPLNYIIPLQKYSHENIFNEINMVQYANIKCPIKYIVYRSLLLNKIFYIPADKLYHTSERTYRPIKSWKDIYTSYRGP